MPLHEPHPRGSDSRCCHAMLPQVGGRGAISASGRVLAERT
jgi:hypothetical protein